METLAQSPTDDQFVQNPYDFYERARNKPGALFWWEDYGLPCATSYAAVWALLRDRRLGRAPPPESKVGRPAHQADFWSVEDHSLLQLEPPKHSHLRGLVLRAFTSRRIAALDTEIAALAHQLIDNIDDEEFDLIPAFAKKIPVIVIARLLGIPENRADDLLAWSHDMVGMYQAGRTLSDEIAAAKASREFSVFLSEYINFRRARPADDLITHLILAEEEGERLSVDELISTCILLLNAGHEATVHTIGNGVKALIEIGAPADVLGPEKIDATVEEILRFDPPLHMFNRYVYEDVEVGTQTLTAGSEVACLLGAANRDPGRWDMPDQFDPGRSVQTNASLGAGVHFCLGAPLARLELKIALPILLQRFPKLTITNQPRYADKYHFHGLTALRVKG